MLINRQSAKQRTGSHTVEMAMVLPVFFVFFFGLLEVSRGLMVNSLMVNASRVGCRIGSLPGKTNADVSTSISTALLAQGISGHTTVIKLNGTATTAIENAVTGDTVTVEVTVPIDKVSWIPKASFVVGALGGQYSLPHE
jgi:Flp pilus assembly protein TadG